MKRDTKLPPAVLAVLGLAAAGSEACGIFGPCLNIDIGETGVGACLSPVEETGDPETGKDTGIGPCLDVPEDTADSGSSESQQKIARPSAEAAVVTRRLAADGVLSADLAARLTRSGE